MKALLKDVNIDIGNEINNKGLDELQKEFKVLAKKILVFKEDPYSDNYHMLLPYLWKLQHKIESILWG